MFVRFLMILVLVAALAWAIGYATAGAALRDARHAPWPYALGSIDDVDHHPPQAASAEAKQLAAIMRTLDIDDPGVETYVAAQVSKKDDTIDAPPANLAAYEAPMTEVSRIAAAAGERIVWGPDGLPWSFSDAADLLGALALSHARNGDAAGAWDRAHAMWVLARSAARAYPYGAQTALQIERSAAAIARKLPAPAPPWVADLGAVDARRETAASIQQLTLMRLRSESKFPGPLIVLRPISDFIEASNLRRARAATESMAAAPRCRFAIGHEVLFPESIYRAARIDAELEAETKVIALKNERARVGQWPPTLSDAGASRCADSHWIYSVSPGGKTMSLRMSWDVAAEPDVKSSPALEFSY